MDFSLQGPKLKISGTVYQDDEISPAKDVIIYIYHTNQSGIYPTNGDEKGWARRHGYIRGWMKTDDAGKYSFYTLKPGTIPSGDQPAHIHITILEPNGKYYWIESYIFDDDPLIKNKDISHLRGGGSNILKLQIEDELWVGNRDIVLGKNIPGYK
jgi:protocatechuate 3,4-dioxygenase beta subunit